MTLAAAEMMTSGIVGLAVGDALGVPVEFHDREFLRRDPVTGMRGYGSHRHPRSQLACAMYVEIAAGLIRGSDMSVAVSAAQKVMTSVVADRFPNEKKPFARLLSQGLELLAESEISGSGYVLNCLEASLWCSLNAESYESGVLQAVNLGEDTDTTGAVTGGLLGLRFGLKAIPPEWIQVLVRKNDIFNLCQRFQLACQQRWESDQ
jgi:ADP-ribosylglycohydrolase